MVNKIKHIVQKGMNIHWRTLGFIKVAVFAANAREKEIEMQWVEQHICVIGD